MQVACGEKGELKWVRWIPADRPFLPGCHEVQEMLPPVVDLSQLVFDLRGLALMAGSSETLSHLLELYFVLLGNSNFLLIILHNK